MNSTRKTANALLLKGSVLIVLGIIGLAVPLFYTIASMYLFAIILLIAGFTQIIMALISPTTERKIFSVLFAILYIWLGVTTIIHPIQISSIITLVIGLIFVGVGAIRILKAIHVKGIEAGWLYVNAFMAIILGGLIYAEWPISGIWVIGLFIAIELFLSGVAALVVARKLYQLQSQ